MFNPNPCPDWSKKYDFKRFSKILNLVFQFYIHALEVLQENPVRPWELWSTNILDEKMNTRNMYL
jgi:hypothetical protein